MRGALVGVGVKSGKVTDGADREGVKLGASARKGIVMVVPRPERSGELELLSIVVNDTPRLVP